MSTSNLHNVINDRDDRNATHPLYPSSGRQPVNLPLPEEVPAEKPFRVELYRTDERGGKFTPAARLIVTRSLRTSGFLRDLPDAEARTLLLLITFLRPDGRCEVSVPEAASALDIAPVKARARLDRLTTASFGNLPVVRVTRRDSGLDGYVLSTTLVEEQQALPEADTPEPIAALPARRDEIIAHSRSLYANPRAEVEEMILTQQLGHAAIAAIAPIAPVTPPDTSTPEGAARQAMTEIGLPREQIDLLIASFPIEKITEQIAWLPHRHPKDAGKLLVSAIRHDYEPPAYIRLQQALEADAAKEVEESLSDSTVSGEAV